MFLTLLKKELIMELRSKQMVLSMLVFALSIILIIALSSNVSKVILMNYSPGLFWLMNLFIVTLAVHRSFFFMKKNLMLSHYFYPVQLTEERSSLQSG